MYEIRRYKDGQYEVYELVDSRAKAWVKAAPERGGIIIGYGVEGTELLFLNNETFQDEQANVRGGIPILFPISGQLENGQYEWEGISYTMKNHGFARNMPWEVIETGATNDGAFMTIRLKSNEETKKSYPFDFEVIYTYRLKDGKLSIEQEYRNESDVEMPIYPGFHPYFKTSEKDLPIARMRRASLIIMMAESSRFKKVSILMGKRNPWSSLMQKRKALSSRCRKSLSLCYWSMGLSFAMWSYGQRKAKGLFVWNHGLRKQVSSI